MRWTAGRLVPLSAEVEWREWVEPGTSTLGGAIVTGRSSGLRLTQ
tara:strand:+ start:5484 stop:5618 length:135 start_codon:yes stop_codon:yes gene_type:complete